jgi:pimeloyl-ACP methyl ester carboxylesterase
MHGAVRAGDVTPAASASIASVKNCDVGYRVYRAATTPQPMPAALIAHGFLRNGEFMRGWAEALAAAGLTAVTVDLCASSSPDGRHADNGADLVALRRTLGIRDVVYVGVSAGGLAALVAASLDRDATRGVLLLDPTNAGGQARAAAGRVSAPVAALVARPQICNAWRNIDRALETLADVTIVKMGRVSHCDFEWPTDRFCRVACVTLRVDDDAVAQARIRAAGLGFVEAVARNDPHALSQWKASLGRILGDDLSPPDDDPARASAVPPPR